jgi:dihydroorotate dehydrogenase (NAD+) catalytic subunit
MGGVSCPEDVVEMMLAGATAVQVGASNLQNPFACPEIIDGLPPLLERLGVSRIAELIGAAHY